ncbi:MAG TPA: hypothetical protein GXX38_09350 [Clostridia bacterium]|nr:hypothetical protein [Clostridia bacterium]
MALMRREYGQEQPYIPLGIFKLRLPGIHFGLEVPELIQGLFLIATPMSSFAAHQEMLGIPFELCILMITLNSLLYELHVCLGDPVSAGWITPAIPLILAWGKQFQPGVERIQATICLGYFMGFVFLFMGITGLAKKVVNIIPNSLRTGIIFGAGVASTISVFGAGGRMEGVELPILLGIAVCILTMYSVHCLSRVNKNKFIKLLVNFGMLPGMVVAFITAYATGIVPFPGIQMGIIPFHRWPELLQNYTIFGVGFPPGYIWIKAIPMVITAYIIAFGDFVFAEVVTKEADIVREDEVIDYNGNRSNIISGMRNIILATVAPYGSVLSGPLWGATHVSIVERYKQGPEAMNTIYGGLFSLNIALMCGTIFWPLISLFRPCLPIGLSLTMMVQAYACFYISMEMVNTKEDRGVAGLTGLILATKGAAWGLAAGIILYFLVGRQKEVKKEIAA